MSILDSCAWYVPISQVPELFDLDLGQAQFASILQDFVEPHETRRERQQLHSMVFNGYPDRPCGTLLKSRTLYRCLDPAWFLWTGLGDTGERPGNPGAQTMRREFYAGLARTETGWVPEAHLSVLNLETAWFKVSLRVRERSDSQGMIQHFNHRPRDVVLSALAPAEELV